MVLTWTPYAVPGIVAAALALLLGLFVVRTRPDRVQNRRLALMLLFEGVTLFLLAGGSWLFADRDVVLYAHLLGAALVLPKAFVYLSFLSTLETRLARPLRTRPAQILLVEGAISAFIVGLITHRMWFVGTAPGGEIATWMAVPGPAFIPFMAQGIGVMFLFGLVFAIAAWREARTEHARRQARMFMYTFGARDVLFAFWAFTLPHVPITASWWPMFFVSVGVIWVVYIPMVAYGILKTQLFDIDIKIKFAIKGTTLAGIFVAVFFVVSEAAATVLSAQMGTFTGLAAAGVLVFALTPLQRFAARIADTAMPHVAATPEYLSYKKLEVYRAALDGALDGGEITARERAILSRLQAQLGIRGEDAVAMERELVTTRTGTAA